MGKQQLFYGNTYAAVEHAEKGSFHSLQLLKKKDEFIISKSTQSEYFETILTELKGQKHVFLILNDAQVLSKKVARSSSEAVSIIRTAFPNISIGDFYYEIFTTETDTFLSIARKQVVDALILKYKEVGISVIDFSLGNIAVKNLHHFITNETIFSSNAKIAFQENTVQAINKEEVSEEIYKINDLEISNTAILPLAGILSYYTNTKASSIAKNLEDNYVQKRFFDISLKAGLSLLLGILLVNFFFFSTYRDQFVNLSGELQLSETYKKQLNTLQNKVIQKKQLVKSVNSASNSKLSQYIDELGISVPNTILLTQIAYQPKKGIQKAAKKLQFDRNKIIVKGTSKANEAFTKWISILEKTAWVETVSIKEYGKGKKTSAIADFEFIITTYE